MGFQGSVESFSLADVFQNLATNQQTGTLRIFTPSGTARHILFENGQVKFLSHGSQKPLLLGEILVGRGVATAEQIAQALARQIEIRAPLGACLVDLGLLTQVQVDELVRHQIEEEIYDLFGWEQAQFEFVDGPAPPDLFVEQPSFGGALKLPISRLIMEAARRVDEWDQLRKQIPSFKDVYAVNRDARAAVDSGQLEASTVEKRVLSLIDGARDVEDLISDSSLFRFEVLNALGGFIHDSMITTAPKDMLAQAAARLEREGLSGRRCKVLERLLAIGGDNAEVRHTLAEAQAADGQMEKAAIHFSVLAEGELKNDHEDAAIALYRKILQGLPQHMPSRDRLGGLYAKRGQKKEAIIQYQELMRAYASNQQHAEARAACAKALDCEPQNIDLRQELSTLYMAENDRASASREYENIGDFLAKGGQTKAAADNYRKAMQCMPSLTHLRKKLASVILTQEDRRARTKRTLVIGAVVVAASALLGLAALYEFNGWQGLKRLEARVSPLSEDAKGYEDQRRWHDAKDRYQAILEQITASRIGQRWSPFFKVDRVSIELKSNYERLHNVAQENYRRQVKGGEEDSFNDLANAERLIREDHIYEAHAILQEVVSREFASAEQKSNAGKMRESVAARIGQFEETRERAAQPSQVAFKDVGEEYFFKEQFLRNFKRVPQFPKNMERPVRFIPNVDGGEVYLDGELKGVVNRTGANVFRYHDFEKPRTFEIRKAGYKALSFSTHDLSAEKTVLLEREFAHKVKFEWAWAGDPYFDGVSLWIGTAEGGLVQLNSTLDKTWEFKPKLKKQSIERGVLGRIHQVTIHKELRLLYVTQGGECIVVKPGDPKPHVPTILASKDILTAPATVASLAIAGDRPCFIVPTGKKVRAFDAGSGTELWGAGSAQGSEELPAAITATPVVVQINNNQFILAGCENGRLYAIDTRTGRRDKLLEWTAGNMAIRGTPFVSGEQLYASAADGKLYVFKPQGGRSLNDLLLGGTLDSAAVVQGEKFFCGTSSAAGFHILDLQRWARIKGFSSENLSGAVRTAPLVLGSRVYFATDLGAFYALEARDKSYELSWVFREPSQSRVVGAPILIVDQTKNLRRVAYVCYNGSVYLFDEE